MGFAIILIITFIVIPILGVLFLWFLVKRLYRKGYKKLSIFIPVLIIIFVGYEVYTSLYPNDNFYIEDFEKYSGMKFPVSGKILEKAATYPDLHGHYMSMALIQLSDSDYLELKNKLKINRSAKLDTSKHPFYGNTAQFKYGQKDMEIKDFDSFYDILGLNMVIGFGKDGKTIFYQKGI